MDSQQLDVIVRVSGVTLLLLVALIVMRDARARRTPAWFLPLALCLSGFLIGNTSDPSLRLTGPVGAAAHILSGYAAVFLWWFCLASFDQGFKPRGPVLAIGLAWLGIASADRGLLGPAFADKGLSWVLVAVGFGLVAHLAWRVLRDRAGDLLETRREARIMVVALLAGQLLVEFAKEFVFGLDWRPRAFTITQNAAILAFALWLLALFLRADSTPLTPAPRVAADPTEPENEAPVIEVEDKLMGRLRTLVDIERVYLNSELTFDAFVQRMGAPERAVRRLINHRLGHDHFRAFLNAYRVAEARRLLADPRRAGDKLIAIALDSGFASLASFNRSFRAIEGRAPGEYRATLGAVRALKPAISGLDTASEERSAAF